MHQDEKDHHELLLGWSMALLGENASFWTIHFQLQLIRISSFLVKLKSRTQHNVRHTVGVEEITSKLHLGRTQRIVGRECQPCCEHTAFKAGALRTTDTYTHTHLIATAYSTGFKMIVRDSCGNLAVCDFYGASALQQHVHPPSTTFKCKKMGACLNYHVNTS